MNTQLLCCAALSLVQSVAIAGNFISAGGPPVQGQYIIKLRDDMPSFGAREALLQDLVATRGGGMRRVFAAVFNGGVAILTEPQARALARLPMVDYVEEDALIWASEIQSPATWGIDRIDQQELPLTNSYGYSASGRGVTAYVIDTGIQVDHLEFGGRARIGTDVIGGNGGDCNGHGTHVAGSIGGAVYGIAKDVAVVAVRVLDCNGAGTISGVIAGVDWVTRNAVKPSVANMSLSSGASASLDTAVRNSLASGITYTIAAGNSGANACYFSPARVPGAITVGATTANDVRASYSNFGKCLDLFAPGSSIKSAWVGSESAANTISGTSMAAPHVAGVAALYLQTHPAAGPTAVRNALVGAAALNKLTRVGSGSPNALIQTIAP
jgi:subtilisin family serine protease